MHGLRSDRLQVLRLPLLQGARRYQRVVIVAVASVWGHIVPATHAHPWLLSIRRGTATSVLAIDDFLHTILQPYLQVVVKDVLESTFHILGGAVAALFQEAVNCSFLSN